MTNWLKKISDIAKTILDGIKLNCLLEWFDLFKNKIVGFVDSYKYGRVFVCCIAVILTFFGYDWCNNPKVLHVKVYDAIGSSTKLCALYEWADVEYSLNDKKPCAEVMEKTVEALSKLKNQEGSNFLGEKLIVASTTNEMKRKIISELKNNNRDALDYLVTYYGEQKNTESLINLFNEYIKDEELNRESYRCIDFLALIDDDIAGNFLSSILVSSEQDKKIKDGVVKSYEKVDKDAINKKIDAFDEKVRVSKNLLLADVPVIEAYGQYDRYRTKVTNVLFRTALIGLKYDDVDKNIELIELVRKYADSSKTGIYNVVQNLCDKLILEGEKYKEATANRDNRHKELNSEIKEAEKELQSNLSEKDERLKNLRMFFDVTVPMWEDPAFRQKLVYTFGLNGALESISEFNKSYWKNLMELDEIHNGYPKLRQKINALKANKDEKLRVYDAEVDKKRISYETLINKIKIFHKEAHYLDDVVVPDSTKTLTNVLGLFLGESISKQPVKYQFEDASGWSYYYNCVDIDELRLEDVVPVDKVSVKKAVLRCYKKEDMEIVVLMTEGTSKDIVRYLTESYGLPYSLNHMWAWETGGILIRYSEYEPIKGCIEIMKKDFYNFLVKNNL